MRLPTCLRFYSTHSNFEALAMHGVFSERGIKVIFFYFPFFPGLFIRLLWQFLHMHLRQVARTVRKIKESGVGRDMEGARRGWWLRKTAKRSRRRSLEVKTSWQKAGFRSPPGGSAGRKACWCLRGSDTAAFTLRLVCPRILLEDERRLPEVLPRWGKPNA